jgi:predicted RNA polymerase sigma factor
VRWKTVTTTGEREAIEAVVRIEYPRIIARVTRIVRDVGIA